MFISWLGLSAFKIEYKSGDSSAVLLIDPYLEKGEQLPRSLAANVVLLTRGDQNTLTFQKDPYTVSLPGEYETEHVSVFGFSNPKSKTAPVVYRFSVEGITFAHLGMLDKPIDDALVAELDGVDVLLIPAGGHSVLSAENASKLVTQLEPRVVAPTCVKSKGTGKSFDSSAKFLKEIGASNTKEEGRIRLRKKDLPTDTMQPLVFIKE